MDFFPLSEAGDIDPSWLSAQIHRPVKSARVRDMTTMGGMAGSFHLVDVALQNSGGSHDEAEATQNTSANTNTSKAAEAEEAQEMGTNKEEDDDEEQGSDEVSLTLVLKTLPKANLGTSKTMGLWREANFYNELAQELPEGLVPKVWFAKGDAASGEKVLLMENLSSHVSAGVFFGPGNPNNWALAGQLDALVEKAGGQTAVEVAQTIFRLHAKLHAQFWRSKQLLGLEWLQGAAWLKGEGEEQWHAQQAMVKGHFDKMMRLIDEGKSPVEYDAHTIACLKAAFAAVSWEDFQTQIKARPYTACQGDCHAGNALWPGRPDVSRGVALIDFEAVALGSGAQELGQFLISHMTPELRRTCEKDLVRDYYEQLTTSLKERGLTEEAEAYTFDECWGEYVAGGIGRWTFFVPLLTGMCPPKMNEFFRDQLAAFLKDHITDPTDMGMPRV